MQRLKQKIGQLEEKLKMGNKQEILMVECNYKDDEQERGKKLLRTLAEKHPGKTRDDFKSVFFILSYANKG